jgi:hypothetical protein
MLVLAEANLFGPDLTGTVADKDTEWLEGFDPVAARGILG